MPDALAEVRLKIETDYQEFRGAARKWSWSYYGFQVGTALLTALSALIIKLDYFKGGAYVTDFAAIFSTMATFGIAWSASTRFKEKWIANRVAAFAVRDLSYAIEKTNANADDILTKLQIIGLTRNNEILGLNLPDKLDAKKSAPGSP